jgi:hypothetical protein
MRLRQIASIASLCLLAVPACGDDGDDTGRSTPAPSVTLTVASFGCYASASLTADVTVASSATRPWIDHCRRQWETGRFGGPTPAEFEVCLATDGPSPGQLTALVFPERGACADLGLIEIEGG